MPRRATQSSNSPSRRQTWRGPGAGPGFTLIELLVVIAIIAILSAILFPVFATARAKARKTRDVSNLRQVMLAVAMYYDDYDEAYPQGRDNGNGDADYLRAQIWPYIRNDGILVDSQKKWVMYIHHDYYGMMESCAIRDSLGRFPHPDSYQAFFAGEDETVDLLLAQAANRDNIWVDVDNKRIIDFRKVQQGWPTS